MRRIGGPLDGTDFVITETPGVPDPETPGMVVEFDYSEPEKEDTRIYFDPNPKPSIPGVVERYQFRDEGWYYVAPTAGGQ